MFNRQPYNRGKFNVQSSQTIGNSGIGLIVMSTNTVQVSKTISAKGSTSLCLKHNVDGTIVKYINGYSSLLLDAYGKGTKIFIVAGNIANMVMKTESNQSLAGESAIILKGLILKPGDELIINTCDMTITINGQNAMEYFSDESDFFKLLSGINTLIYSDGNTNRNIYFDVIWKDRWL